MEFKDFRFTPLLPDYAIKPFDCGDRDLNNFLLDDACKYLKDLMAVTYLLEDTSSNRTVAYFSLLNDKISFDPERKNIWNRLSRPIPNPKRRKHYPAVKVGRFAVSEDYAGQGIGQVLMGTIKHMFTHGNRTGCRFLTVDAYSQAVGFYLKAGFDFITDKDSGSETRLMYYDLKKYILE